MVFKVVFTKNGQDTYNQCLDYILDKFQDRFAAKSLNDDIGQTLTLLAIEPASYPVCEHEGLYVRNIRKIHLKKHNYKIFYHIVNGCEIHVDAIIHDKQDFENLLG